MSLSPVCWLQNMSWVQFANNMLRIMCAHKGHWLGFSDSSTSIKEWVRKYLFPSKSGSVLKQISWAKPRGPGDNFFGKCLIFLLVVVKHRDKYNLKRKGLLWSPAPGGWCPPQCRKHGTRAEDQFITLHKVTKKLEPQHLKAHPMTHFLY